MKKIKISDFLVEQKITEALFTKVIEEIGLKISLKVKTLSEEDAAKINEFLQKKQVSLTEVRKGDVLEKRVQTSVIRRRKVVEPEVEPVSSLPTESTLKSRPASKDEKGEPLKAEGRPLETVVPSQEVKVSETRVPKINVVESQKSSEVTKEAPKLTAEQKEKALKEEEELAKKRKKAFLKKRAEEYDIHGFNRAERIYQPKKKKQIVDKSKMMSTQITTPKADKRVVRMSGQISVGDLAQQLKIKSGDVIKKLMSMGMMVTVNQLIDVDTATLVSQEYQYEVQSEVVTEDVLLLREAPADPDLKIRPPVVTIMGHVDHGKTTLLDTIRKSDVALKEAGGITQHIGAYMVDVGNQRMITFIDTPGHEAFSAMRARGAKTTDIVIIVVAADDGVMPQTKEAIAHALEAKVPIVVALNKIDKPGASADKVKKQLAEMDLLAEDWGGKTIVAPVSAKSGQGVKELLELILLQADVLELKASPVMTPEGVVLEAKIAKGLGPVATVLVQQGTLRKGDIIVAGTSFGRIRLLLDDKGKQLKEACPSFAVEISGLESVPLAGERIYCFKDEMAARKVIDFRLARARDQKQSVQEKVTLESLYAKMEQGEMKELKLIVKADVQGSVEVMKQTLEKLSTPKIKINVIFSAPGGVTESDVNLAAASGAVIIGFNVRPDSKAEDLAKSQKVEIKPYSIIYDVVDDLKKAMVGQLEPTFKEKVIGKAEVRNVFKITKVGTVAGCNVIEGKVIRTCKVRLLRDQVVVYTGKLSSLKRFKDDAKEVLQGYECGMSLENYQDIKEKDIIEAFVMEGVEQVL